MTAPPDALPLIDCNPDRGSFRDDVLNGLQQSPKDIPSKYLYDRRGSQLFDEICTLDAYYPTRTERAIMQTHGSAMTDAVGAGVQLVEYGSGSSLKTRELLDRLDGPAQYVPVDISKEHLLEAAAAIAEDYPHIPVRPVCADYTAPFPLPEAPAAQRTVVYFPGSTIGNFLPAEAQAFLEHIAAVIAPSGGLLVGVDLRKDPAVLRRAYNDPEGVTAAFNKNLLRRINRELEGTFALDQFRHDAPWIADKSRIEMHLVSTMAQTATVAGQSFSFAEGEVIRTEYSHKYTLDAFAQRAQRAGLAVRDVWTDARDWFSVQYLTPVSS
ncbi:L-histidine N(alpha)-methyltransferase [Salisaeta longa]|uniref:L-histidine N(alpha)-methyltransferase n=1 Tax=Salisaeta longa TaxID=503170 RepID=UPI0003B5BC7D|nr:L-histidine N(alpha)-methyltransferase [Salisaeta longa]